MRVQRQRHLERTADQLHKLQALRAAFTRWKYAEQGRRIQSAVDKVNLVQKFGRWRGSLEVLRDMRRKRSMSTEAEAHCDQALQTTIMVKLRCDWLGGLFFDGASGSVRSRHLLCVPISSPINVCFEPVLVCGGDKRRN